MNDHSLVHKCTRYSLYYMTGIVLLLGDTNKLLELKSFSQGLPQGKSSLNYVTVCVCECVCVHTYVHVNMLKQGGRCNIEYCRQLEYHTQKGGDGKQREEF